MSECDATNEPYDEDHEECAVETPEPTRIDKMVGANGFDKAIMDLEIGEMARKRKNEERHRAKVGRLVHQAEGHRFDARAYEDGGDMETANRHLLLAISDTLFAVVESLRGPRE